MAASRLAAADEGSASTANSCRPWTSAVRFALATWEFTEEKEEEEMEEKKLIEYNKKIMIRYKRATTEATLYRIDR
jgi:hypothetical protein